jgi:hypothetical protein
MWFASIQSIVQWMQGGLGLRQSGGLNDQHLEKDIIRHVEDLQDMLEV